MKITPVVNSFFVSAIKTTSFIFNFHMHDEKKMNEYGTQDVDKTSYFFIISYSIRSFFQFHPPPLLKWSLEWRKKSSFYYITRRNHDIWRHFYGCIFLQINFYEWILYLTLACLSSFLLPPPYPHIYFIHEKSLSYMHFVHIYSTNAHRISLTEEV